MTAFRVPKPSYAYPPTRTAVYRLYDADGRLLYVGIGESYLARWKSHAKKKAWWPLVAKRDVIWFPTRLDALYEEARAIRLEAPLHNEREGISEFGWATIRTRSGPVADPELDVRREPPIHLRIERVERGDHVLVTLDGVAAAVLVPVDWFQRAAEALGEPADL